MAKSDSTLKLEKLLWNHTKKRGTFGCYEVTIGWYGKERVDYITYNTEGIWRCYEIKASTVDFNSNDQTLVGKLRSQLASSQRRYKNKNRQYNELRGRLKDTFGSDWESELE